LEAIGDRRLHHIGFVVASIEAAAPSFAAAVGGTWNGVITEDPNQKVRVSFIDQADPSQPQFELVDPGRFEEAPVLRFLNESGGGLHHVCYEVPNLEAALDFSRKARSTMVRKPLPAPAFGGRRIAWVFTREKLLIEYLEAEAQAASAPAK
jgi:catechol 2,3-dioxygenase-like lactoylglutathione lyase family enzyme